MADNLFKVKIVTPEKIFYEGEVEILEFNTTEGEIGIYKNHIPMTVIVKPGVITMTNGEDVKKAALHSGFVEILPDLVMVLAELVEWPDEIDVERAKTAGERARERIAKKENDVDMDRAQMALMKSIARISAFK